MITTGASPAGVIFVPPEIRTTVTRNRPGRASSLQSSLEESRRSNLLGTATVDTVEPFEKRIIPSPTVFGAAGAKLSVRVMVTSVVG